MTPKKPTLPGDKIDLAKMAGHFKNKIQQRITGGPRPVPGQTVVGTPPKPAGYARPTVSGIPKPAPSGPLVPVRGGGMAPQSAAYTMKKGGTTTLHSITKSSKKSNW
jgi:hypothetical protein